MGFYASASICFRCICIIQAIMTLDIVLGVLGLVVGGMAFFNVACCGANGC